MIIVIIVVLSLLLLSYYLGRGKGAMTRVRSDIDRRTYLVRDMPRKQESADILAKLCQKIQKLKLHLSEGGRNGTIAMNNDLHQLVDFNQYSKVSERKPGDKLTSYTLNKDSMHFCFRNGKGEAHDLNTLTFVLIHELAHLSCAACNNHDKNFNKRFHFLIHEAVSAGIYTPQNFRKNPVTYCGITINDSPLDFGA